MILQTAYSLEKYGRVTSLILPLKVYLPVKQQHHEWNRAKGAAKFYSVTLI